MQISQSGFKYIRHPENNDVRYIQRIQTIDGTITTDYGWCESDAIFHSIPIGGLTIIVNNVYVDLSISKALMLFN